MTAPLPPLPSGAAAAAQFHTLDADCRDQGKTLPLQCVSNAFLSKTPPFRADFQTFPSFWRSSTRWALRCSLRTARVVAAQLSIRTPEPPPGSETHTHAAPSCGIYHLFYNGPLFAHASPPPPPISSGLGSHRGCGDGPTQRRRERDRERAREGERTRGRARGRGRERDVEGGKGRRRVN